MLFSDFKREFINEASSLNTLGATKNQIKAIYKGTGGKWTERVPDANASWTPETSKKSIVSMLKAAGYTRAGVTGFDKAGNMFIALANTNAYFDKEHYQIKKISPEGKITEWGEKVATKALSHFQGVKTYYISKGGALQANSKDKQYDPDKVDKDDYFIQLGKIIEKDMKKIFEDARDEVGKKVKAEIDKGELGKALKLLNKITMGGPGDKFDSERNPVALSFSEFVSDGWYGNISSQLLDQIKLNIGYSSRDKSASARAFALNLSSTQDIRKAGAEVLKGLKKDIEELLSKV